MKVLLPSSSRAYKSIETARHLSSTHVNTLGNRVKYSESIKKIKLNSGTVFQWIPLSQIRVVRGEGKMISLALVSPLPDSYFIRSLPNFLWVKVSTH